MHRVAAPAAGMEWLRIPGGAPHARISPGAHASALDSVALSTAASKFAAAVPVSQETGVPVATQQVAASSGGTVSRELPPSAVGRVVGIIQGGRPAGTRAQIESLFREAISAAAKGSAVEALGKAVELAGLDAERAEALVLEPAFARIQANLNQQLQQLAPAAKIAAGEQVASATDLIQALGIREHPSERMGPETVLFLAGRYLQTGRHADAQRASDLAQVVIDVYGIGAAAVPRTVLTGTLPVTRTRRAGVASVIDLEPGWAAVGGMIRRLRRDARPRLLRLWFKAPLLLLLVGWLAMGLAVALFRHDLPPLVVHVSFDLWGIGFLALVGLGFVARIGDLARAPKTFRSR